MLQVAGSGRKAAIVTKAIDSAPCDVARPEHGEREHGMVAGGLGTEEDHPGDYREEQRESDRRLP